MCLRFVGGLFALATLLPAQVLRDEWVVSSINDFINNSATGALWHVDAAMLTATQLSGQTPNMASANCVVVDDLGVVFYGSGQSASVPVPNPGEIFQVLVAGTAVAAEIKLTTGPIDSGSVTGITLVRDRIWFVTDAGNVGWIPKAGGAAPTIVLNLATAGAQGLGQAITSNGREVFVGTSLNGGQSWPTVYVFDSASAAPTLAPLASLGGSSFAMSLGRDGKVIVGRNGGQIWEVDPVTAATTRLNVGTTAPQGSCNGTWYHPWLQMIGNVPGFGSTARVIGFYDVVNNLWPTQLLMDTSVPSGIASAHEQPFLLFGKGCPGANALEPRLGWTGLPKQGQNFTLTLRAADPIFAFLFLGFSNQVSSFGALPYDLSQIGGNGCSLHVSLDLAVGVPVDAAGNAAVPFAVPVDPALFGGRLFVQWCSVSGVNTLGLAFSDAAELRLR